MSLVAESYFIKFAAKNQVGLKCWWNPDTSWNVGNEVQNLYSSFFGHNSFSAAYWAIVDHIWIATGGVFDGSFFIDYLKSELKHNRPVAIGMAGFNFGEWVYGHSILVYGWAGNATSGLFLAYDNQDNSSPRLVTYSTNGPALVMYYADTANRGYYTFMDASLGFMNSDIDNILLSHPQSQFGLGASCQPQLNDGLIAYYPLDGNTNDASGNGHNGTKYGNTSFTVEAMLGKSAYFDGSGDYILSILIIQS